MIAENLSGLFDSPVKTVVASPEMYNSILVGQEAEAAGGFAPRRYREFAAGRESAREALRQLGAPFSTIGRNADRTAIWPDGFVGSISHCEGLCCAVAAKRSDVVSIGIDVEARSPLPRDIHALVCRPEESAGFAALPTLNDCCWSKLTFSAKEAFYKCYYPIVGTFLDFQDLRLHFDLAEDGLHGAFRGELTAEHKVWPDCRPVVGRWRLIGGYVVTAAFVRQR